MALREAGVRSRVAIEADGGNWNADPPHPRSRRRLRPFGKGPAQDDVIQGRTDSRPGCWCCLRRGTTQCP